MLTIKGVVINDLDFKKEDKTGQFKITGAYALMSSTDIVLAKQTFNDGYNGVTVPWSSETEDLKIKLLASVRADVNKSLGIGV